MIYAPSLSKPTGQQAVTAKELVHLTECWIRMNKVSDLQCQIKLCLSPKRLHIGSSSTNSISPRRIFASIHISFLDALFLHYICAYKHMEISLGVTSA